MEIISRSQTCFGASAFSRVVARARQVLVARPPDESLDDVEPLIEDALREAEARGVRGQGVTPFVLQFLHEQSDGRTLRANRELVVQNARLAGEIAVELARG